MARTRSMHMAGDKTDTSLRIGGRSKRTGASGGRMQAASTGSGLVGRSDTMVSVDVIMPRHASGSSLRTAELKEHRSRV